MPDAATPKPATAHEKLLELARKRFKLSSDGETELRQKQLEDKKFAAGDQWPAAIKQQRADDGRPCLTIDRLKPQIKQVTNQQRQMRPAVQVNAVDNAADPKTAEVLQGMVRHIENQSDADDAYDQAGKDQTEIGCGYWRYRTEYVDDSTGNQRIVIDRIRNRFSVYDDPAAQKRDRSDRKFLFHTSWLTREELEARYPNATATSADLFQGLGDEAPLWMDGEKFLVAEYWRVEVTRKPIALPDRKTRTVESRKVYCDHITALEVLESYEWAGKYIPFCVALGEEIDIEGKVDLVGMVRGAKDPQRMFNYWKSATTEAMALAPKAPFLAAEGQLEPYLPMWKSANSKNLPYLLYKPVTLGGTLAPPPQRQTAEPPIQAMMRETQGAENDIRAATGFFDTNQRETREMSGVAIRARQAQGEHGNSDYLDGLARAVRFGGRILVDLIPKIYDAPRVVRILGLDNQPKTVMVHGGQAPPVDPLTGAPTLPEGVKEIYDLSVGEFDVTVTAGPSYATARAEFVEQMAELFKANPALFQVVGDLFFENMDLPNAKQIAERLKKMLPPPLQDQENGPTPEQAQAQLAAMGQQMQLMQQALQQAQQVIETKQVEAQAKIQIADAEIQSKEKIAVLQADVARYKAEIDGQLAQMKLQGELATATLKANAAREAQAADHAMQAASSADDRDAARESTRLEHDHAARMAQAAAAAKQEAA